MIGRAKQGDWVAFYVREHLHIRTLRQSYNVYCRKPEYILTEVFSEENLKILLVVIYRSSHCGFLADVFETISDLFA